MKPPQKKQDTVKQTRMTNQHVLHQDVQQVAAILTFAETFEYTPPAIRAVWSVVDCDQREEDDENRRKRR